MSDSSRPDLSFLGVETALATSGIELAELETFLVVSELGSFSRAAAKLHLSQPAVTLRVQKLETLLGVRLLHRTTRAVTVTEAGARLARGTRDALHQLRGLIAEFRGQASAAHRRVLVTATPMLAATLLPTAIGRFNEIHPEIDVIILDQRHAAALQTIEQSECDLGVLALDEPQPRLRFTPLLKQPIVLVAPENHPLSGQAQVSLRELEQWPVMVLEQYSALVQKIREQFDLQGLSFQPAATAVNLTTLLGMLDAGRGVALLPRAMAQHNASRRRVVVPLSDCDIYRNYGIFVNRKAQLSAAAHSFIDFLRDHCAANQMDGSVRTEKLPVDSPLIP